MKNISALIVIISFFACKPDNNEPNPPEFEGIIVYKISTNSNNLDVFSNEELRNKYGDSATFYFKAGKYRMSFNGEELSEAYYLSDENIEYTLLMGIDTLFYMDCSVKNDQLKDVEEIENTDTILGLPCNQIEVIGDKYSRTYIYSPRLYLDPVHHKNHISGHINEYYSRAKAPFLAYFYEGRVFSTKYRAVSIEEKELDDKLFELPELPQKSY